MNRVHPLGQGVGRSCFGGRCLEEAVARGKALLIAGRAPARGQHVRDTSAQEKA